MRSKTQPIESAIHSPLGKKSTYISEYKRDLLFPILRQNKRDEIGVPTPLPFKGYDVWNAYELSWLNAKGKPLVAMAEFIFPCDSLNLIESKSFKLYLNSFNNTSFHTMSDVTGTLTRDLSHAVNAPVQVNVIPLEQFHSREIRKFSSLCLDELDIECDMYHVEPKFLCVEKEIISEAVYSDLLKSNCLVTGQPDWGSLEIHYTGNKINHAGLLKYIISFRNHNEFHEQCVERIFMDILRCCAPKKLTIEARYTRRGGLDINPYRSTEIDMLPENIRLCRQ